MTKTTFGPRFFADVGRDPAKWVAALRVRLGADTPDDEVLADFFGAALGVTRAEAEPKPATFDALEAMANDWPELRAMFSRSTGGIDVDALVAFLDRRL